MRNVLIPQGSEQTAKECVCVCVWGGAGRRQETGWGAGLPTVLSGLSSLIASDSQTTTSPTRVSSWLKRPQSVTYMGDSSQHTG